MLAVDWWLHLNLMASEDCAAWRLLRSNDLYSLQVFFSVSNVWCRLGDILNSIFLLRFVFLNFLLRLFLLGFLFLLSFFVFLGLFVFISLGAWIFLWISLATWLCSGGHRIDLNCYSFLLLIVDIINFKGCGSSLTIILTIFGPVVGCNHRPWFFIFFIGWNCVQWRLNFLGKVFLIKCASTYFPEKNNY